MSPEPPHRDRLFFALRLPPEAVARIGLLEKRLRHDHRLRGRRVAADRLHATVYALELRTGVPEALVDGLRTTAARLEVPPFEVCFNAVASFLHKPKNRPVVLLGESEDLSDLIAFQRRLMNGLAAAGLADPRVTDRFTPHVTLLYDDEAVPLTQIEPIRWIVRDFVLIRSHVGLTRHDELGRWMLRG